uniref:dolichyl-phosphate beta-glucosyltransferase n=1 Tax=Colletotrichum fructicola (strain Nara gc5) TaxID=1213859 RepID=L2GH66_COLFN
MDHITQASWPTLGVALLVLGAFGLLTVIQSMGAVPKHLQHFSTVPIDPKQIFITLHLVAPKPRAVLPSERTYLTSSASGKPVATTAPCWFDRWFAERRVSETNAHLTDPRDAARILPTLEEAVAYLDAHFGRPSSDTKPILSPTTSRRRTKNAPSEALSGYEIIIVDDGSRDSTVDVCLEFAHKNGLHDVLRVIKLERNRGKGGAFSDLGRLIQGCEEVVDGSHRGVAIGSRAHLVGSEAVVKRSALRNFLMRSFHLVLMILTPPATSRLRDTQCGFKLFTRAALPHIVPYMHTEGWIFDIEMLLLAESAPPAPVIGEDGSVIGTSPGIHVAEVPVDWHEVPGSKLSVISDSIKMAIGLAVLRGSWMMGVYRRRLT